MVTIVTECLCTSCWVADTSCECNDESVKSEISDIGKVHLEILIADTAIGVDASEHHVGSTLVSEGS